MEVLHAFNLIARADVLNDSVVIHVIRHGIHAHSETLSQQMHCVVQDDERYDDADNRIQQIPSGKVDDYSGDDYSQRNERICCHVQKGTSGIDVTPLVLHEKQRADSAHKDSYRGSP